ncbi:YbaK/EbsC family protein [Sulfitobacter sp. F26169L]|uniref:YbaK/EbsC family protein n=1 Tax=Sulfitobacter sp. F26169L TaxID=2996015 RepID=UPI0022609190|nr:YbaK/EbsC family protein [Sulfitobacter sp. F26169L]MCX7566434.1 YbaK/EbsC family protein [Sulfitobacter sp. F26169L]
MGKSITRVRQAAEAAGLEIDIIKLPTSARTAAQAAESCNCDVGQIVKSLLFEGQRTGKLMLILVSGKHDLNLNNAEALFGEPLGRADPKRVRSQTGFAIGGVAPIGHMCPMPTFMDDALLAYKTVWGAGGAPETVFEIEPNDLLAVTGATVFSNPLT